MERGRIAAAGAPVVDRLLGLEAELRVVLALAFFVVFVMVVVDFELCMRVLLGRLLGRLQILFWLEVVIIIEMDLAGPEAALRNPVAERLFFVLVRSSTEVDRDLRQVRDGLMRGARIC